MGRFVETDTTEEDAVGCQLGDRGHFLVPMRFVAEYARLRRLNPDAAQLEMTERLLTARIVNEETPAEPMRARYRSRTENIDMTAYLRRNGPLWVVTAATVNNRK